MGVYCPKPRGTWPECYASGMAACHCFQSSDGRRDPASVSVSCASSSCAPHDARGSARHGCAALVGADVPGGPRGRIVYRRRPCACGGRAAGDVRPYHVYGPARHMICAALRVRRYHVRASARVMGARAWGRRSRKWRRVVSIWPLRTSLPISVERADRSTLR